MISKFKSAILLLSAYGLSNIAYADVGGTGGGNTITITNPLGCSDAVCVVQAILSAIYRISIPVVSLMVLVGAFQIMTAAGNPEKVSSGRKTIIYAVVGFVIVLIASGGVSIIKDILGAN